MLEIIAASMGLAQQDHDKRLKMLQDAEAILLQYRDLLARRGIDEAAAREVIAAMLADQPLPLTGKTDHFYVRGGGGASLPGEGARPTMSPLPWYGVFAPRPGHPDARLARAASLTDPR